MNTKRFIAVSRLAVAATLVAASACAHAGGGVYWSVNVDAPVQGAGRVSTAVSNVRQGVVVDRADDRSYDRGYDRGYERAYYEPAPRVVYAPPPVIVQQPVYYQPQPVVYERPRARCFPIAARVIRDVHYGLGRWHQNMAAFHESREAAWDGGGRMMLPRDGGRGGYEGGERHEHRHHDH
jgi:hypothetical protein